MDLIHRVWKMGFYTSKLTFSRRRGVLACYS